MPFYAMGRMEEHFEDPEEYNPHRWLSDEKGVSKFASLPFGFGARMCIGKRIAELQLKMSIAYVSLMEKTSLLTGPGTSYACNCVLYA